MCRLKCGTDNLEFRHIQITRKELHPMLKYENVIFFFFMLVHVSTKIVYSVYIETLYLFTPNEVLDNES